MQFLCAQGGKMKNLFLVMAPGFVYLLFALSSCSVQDEKPAAKPAPSPAPAAKAEAKAPAEKASEKAGEKAPEKTAEKAKAEKVAGDVGLLDTEKNYMILVTKEGKLVTIDFDPKAKVTEIEPTPAKVTDIGLGASAVVQYTKQGDKDVATSIEFKPAKGGD
jgi:hypothetical protein